MQVKKLNWGLSHWLNDELQVELMPHAWLGKRAKRIKINEILPLALINEYTYIKKGVLTHNDYLMT